MVCLYRWSCSHSFCFCVFVSSAGEHKEGGSVWPFAAAACVCVPLVCHCLCLGRTTPCHQSTAAPLRARRTLTHTHTHTQPAGPLVDVTWCCSMTSFKADSCDDITKNVCDDDITTHNCTIYSEIPLQLHPVWK